MARTITPVFGNTTLLYRTNGSYCTWPLLDICSGRELGETHWSQVSLTLIVTISSFIMGNRANVGQCSATGAVESVENHADSPCEFRMLPLLLI